MSPSTPFFFFFASFFRYANLNWLSRYILTLSKLIFFYIRKVKNHILKYESLFLGELEK